MKEGAGIRFVIIAFPLGLLIFGVLSFVFTPFDKNSEMMDLNEAKRLAAASLNRKPVNRADLEDFVHILSEEIGERHVGKIKNLERAAIWIESILSGGNIGYQVKRQDYDAGGIQVRNLIAELPGTSSRDEIIVVGAQYDSIPGCPAANDNGSGVAALISLAQAFAGDQQIRTVRFVAFVNEEPPFFQTEKMGSRVYAKYCKEKGENIVAMISLETIGFFSDKEGSQETPPGLEGKFPTVGNFLAFVGNEQSKFFVDSARSSFQNECGIPALAGVFPESVPGVGWSDHWSFWKSGYSALMVTDTAPYRYPHYHKPTDTKDKINFEKLEKVTQGLKAVIENWANP